VYVAAAEYFQENVVVELIQRYNNRDHTSRCIIDRSFFPGNAGGEEKFLQK